MKELDFTDLQIQEVKVKFPNVTYTLREASGEIAAAYRNESMKCTKFTTEGKVAGVDGIADMEAKLVHYCLLDDKEQRVPLDVIRAWPERYVKQLFNQAKEISGLDEDTLPSLKKQRDVIDAKIAKLEAEQADSKN